MRLVFFGTPDFSVPSLEALHRSRHEVAGVVTQPDRPKGRGLKPGTPPVKQAALQYNLPILQPHDLLEERFLEELAVLQGELFIVVAYRILPPEVFELPLKGTINLHASLLPKYRGAAPIQWAIMNGDKDTGVTTFFIEKHVDTGQWLLQAVTDIREDDTAGTLHDRLADIGADLLVETVNRIEQNTIKPKAQHGEATKAPKILPEHCRIDWMQPARRIMNQIRGLSPSPGAYTFLQKKRIKIYKGSVLADDKKSTHNKGEIISARDGQFIVQTGEHCIKILELQIEGKKRMSADEFLRGCKLSEGTILE